MKITFGLVKVTLSLQGYIIWQALRIILLSTLGRKVESEVAQLCRTLCDLMDYSLLGSSVHEILQTRILEWVAMPFSRGSSQPRSRCLLCLPHWQAGSLPLMPPGKPFSSIKSCKMITGLKNIR